MNIFLSAPDPETIFSAVNSLFVFRFMQIVSMEVEGAMWPTIRVSVCVCVCALREIRERERVSDLSLFEISSKS